MSIDLNVDNIIIDLGNKADKDLTNVVGALSLSAKSYFSGLSMPSDKYIDLTLGASGTPYEAPADGWFCFYTIKSTAGYTYLENNTTSFRTEARTTINGSGCGCYIHARKNDVIRVNYDGVNQNPMWRFYYAQGLESEV